MVKKITGFIILCLSVLLVTSAMAEMPGADPKELWEHITKTSPYTQWKFWDDHRGMLEGNEPHGSFNKVYVNDKTYDSSSAPFKDGAIVVKENYSKKKKLMAITVMYKVHGYNPKAGDWFWARYTPKGKAKPYGKPKGCLGCHSGAADNDFIFLHEFE